ncbi:MAG: PEP-CTERM sorting domain-containing protein [Acidimicrobiales bacterium]
MTPNGGAVGVLNFNISGNTSNLITDNGTFNITDLSLVLNLSGTQTLSQYVLANYSGGTLSGTKFYSTTLANGWSIDYGTLHPNEIVLVNANAVPEPATLGLFLMGLVGGLVLLKRHRAV